CLCLGGGQLSLELGHDRRVHGLGPGLLAARERLAALAAVPIDRDRLEAELPPFQVDLLYLLRRRRLRHVDRLADGARDERLDRGHHPDVAHVVDRGLAVDRLEGAVENWQVLRLEIWCSLDRLALVDVADDLLDLPRAVAELLQGNRDRLVDDLEEALAD